MIPDPKISIGAVSSNGTLQIDFNQEMIVPEFIRTSLYSKVFDIKIVSDIDNSVSVGRFVTNSSRRLQDDSLKQGKEPEQSEVLTFAIQVEKHEA